MILVVYLGHGILHLVAVSCLLQRDQVLGEVFSSQIEEPKKTWYTSIVVRNTGKHERYTDVIGRFVRISPSLQQEAH